MNALQAIVLGVVQGLTEFLPISSSGHLRIVPALLGWDDPGAAFTAVIQLGTMAAVLVYFRTDLWRIATAWLRSLRDPEVRGDLDARMGWYIILGTIPIAVLGLVFKDPIETKFRNLELIGSTLILFGLVMLAAEAVSRRDRPLREITRRDGFLIGCALLVPALDSGRRALGAVRVAPRRRGQPADRSDDPRHAARVRDRVRVDRVPAALPRAPHDRRVRRLPHRARGDGDLAGGLGHNQLKTLDRARRR